MSDKFLITANLRALEIQVSKGEISYGKMIEIINEKAKDFYKKQPIEINGTCKDCKHFQRVKSIDVGGTCLNTSILLENESDGIKVFGSKLENGIILVGQNYGCIHFEKTK